MQNPDPYNDCGDIVLEIDKLIRADRDSLHGNVRPAHAIQNAKNQSTLGKLSALSSAGLPIPVTSVTSHTRAPKLPQSISRAGMSPTSGSYGSDTSPSSVHNMRQARLFNTRFCSYGSDCPYLAKGTCLYAHNKEEVRFRPPPPDGYKNASLRAQQQLDDTKRTISLDLYTHQPQPETVWNLPQSTTEPDWSVIFGASNSLYECFPNN